MSTATRQPAVRTPPEGRRPPSRRALGLVWAAFIFLALFALDLLPLRGWAAVVVAAGSALALGSVLFAGNVRWVRVAPDGRDLAAVALSYIGVVVALRVAFVVFTPERTLGMFLFFAGGLLLGVAVPVVYTVWVRRRPLRNLGVALHNLRATLALALLLATTQFAVTLWGYDLPAPVDWVPLLVMALTVGLFEAVFFRGFIQGRLEASFGVAPAVVGAAGLYALYHVGYGMGGEELWFLFGLGIVYAIAYRLTGNILILWPLLIPLGSFFNNLEAGDIELPWASIAGFADVLALMALVLWLARRRQRRQEARVSSPIERSALHREKVRR